MISERQLLEITREQWLEGRKLGLGGSDAAAVIGLNKFCSPFQLYLEKTGQTEPFLGNDYTEAGQRLEPVVYQWFFDKNPQFVPIPTPKYYTVKHPIHNMIMGSPDGIFMDEEGRMQVLEIKTTRFKIDLDFPPESWFTQAGYYAYILGYSHFTICILEAGFKLSYRSYAVDVEYCEWVVDSCVNFWNNHILTGTPPDPENDEDIVKRYPTDTGEYLEADVEVISQHSAILKLSEQEGQIKDAIDSIKTELKLKLQDKSGYVSENRALFTFKTSKDGTTLDAKKLQEEKPEIYNEFLKVKPGNRSFLVKPL